MNVTCENIDELNAVVKVKVIESDYRKQVDTILKKYRKQAKLPGFRPGMVPMGMVKKMYGTAVLADEPNKMVSDHLYKYIEENKLEILGNPLPKNEEADLQNIESKVDFEFSYSIGLSPKFDVKSLEAEKFNYYKINIDEALVIKQIKDLGRRYGKVSKVDVAEESDMLHGVFTEVDKKGEVVEGGITNPSTVSIEFVEDEKTKKQLIGLKPEDKIVVDAHKVSRNSADMAAMLNIKADKVDDVKNSFEFKIEHVYRVEPHAVNQELFDKLFGPGKVGSEAEFRAKVREDLEKALKIDSDRKLKLDISDKAIEKLGLNLPDSFLKNWLVAANENKISKEEIEKEYDEYAKGLKWQLVENKIIKEYDLKVTPEEAETKAVELLKRQFEMYGMTDKIAEPELQDMAKRLLGNKEEAQKLVQQIYEDKVNELFKTTYKTKDKEVSYDEFVKLVTENKSKFNLLDNIKNKFKF